MQFTTAIFALFAATAIAAPAAISAREVDALNTLQAQAQAFIDQKEASGCQHLKCIAALAGTVVSCGAALAEDGLNPIADAACFAAAGNAILNHPTQCKGC